MAKGQELPELVGGIMELGILFVEKAHDGASVGESVPALLKRLQTDKVFIEAAEGVSSVPDEIRSYGRLQYVKLFFKVLSYVPRILEIYFSSKKSTIQEPTKND